MTEPKKKSEPSKLVLRCAELWNTHQHSDNSIADKIVEEFEVMIDYGNVQTFRKRYPELFETRHKSISRELAAHTQSMNRLLRSSRRMHVTKELAKLDAKRVKSVNH